MRRRNAPGSTAHRYWEFPEAAEAGPGLTNATGERGRFSVSTILKIFAPMIGREQADNLAFTVLRVAAGIIVIPHGVSQLIGGNESFAQSALAQIGISPSPLASYLIIFLELIGGACLAVGFFSRAFAVALAVEMIWVAAIFWSNPSLLQDEFKPWEFPLVFGIVLLLIALHGSGPWSIDGLLQKRL
jgi:putative oxidoreductase